MINFISDIACPWCVVGYYQLKAALQAEGQVVDIRWHPFEINPHIGEGGRRVRENLKEKYGMSDADVEASQKKLTELAAPLGFEFKYTPEFRVYNTFKAHQLLHFATVTESGQSTVLKERLFAALFRDQLDIDNVAVLAQLAGESGLDADAAAEVLGDARYADSVREAQAFWQQHGVSGVPSMVFNERYMVNGAQGVDTYREALRRCAADNSASAQ